MKKSPLVSLLTVCSLALTTTVYGASNKLYPKGCSPDNVEFSGNYLLLNTELNDRDYRVYVVKNISPYEVSIIHPQGNHILDVQLSSTIKPNRMSAVLAQDQNFVLYCQDGAVGYNSTVPCDQVLRACELAVSPVMLSARGQYWITENKSSVGSLFSAIRGEGIYP